MLMEVLIGVLFAAWFVTAYLLSVKLFSRTTAHRRARMFSDSKRKRALESRTMTDGELSRHHARTVRRLNKPE